MLDFDSYIWRGHRNEDFKLESTLDRLARRHQIAFPNSFQKKHLERFKFAVRGRRGPNPARLESENDWWALGQHHGLATPLLDWTQSPFAAAYFAFVELDTPQTEYRAILALHRPSVEQKAKELLGLALERQEKEMEKAEAANPKIGIIDLARLRAEPQREVEFFRPLSDENQRLVNQAGLFSRSPIGTPLDDWVKKNFSGSKDFILMKFLIPDKDRDLCLRMLNRMNINHLTLFPDLYGSSIFTNMHGQIGKY